MNFVEKLRFDFVRYPYTYRISDIPKTIKIRLAIKLKKIGGKNLLETE